MLLSIIKAVNYLLFKSRVCLNLDLEANFEIFQTITGFYDLKIFSSASGIEQPFVQRSRAGSSVSPTKNDCSTKVRYMNWDIIFTNHHLHN